MRIVMVCLGNICRSPMAATVARVMINDAGLGDRVSVESFGTSGYHAGERADPRTDAALRRRGWPVADHRARRLQPADVEGAYLVLCADQSNVSAVRRLASTGTDLSKIRLLGSFAADAADAGGGADPALAEVLDPWSGDDADFDQALELIERACNGLVKALVDALSSALEPTGRPQGPRSGA